MPVDIDWGLLKTPDVIGNGLNAFTAGQQLGQRLAVRQALGNAMTDPNAAVTGLVQAGDLPDANAIINMQMTRSLNNALQTKFSGGGQPAPAPAPTAPPQAATSGQSQAAPDYSSLPPEKVQQFASTIGAMDKLGTELSGLPYEERAARIQQEKPALIQAGVPQQLIDGFDPTDANLAAEHAKIGQAWTGLMGAQGGQGAAPGADVPAGSPPGGAMPPVSGAAIQPGSTPAPQPGPVSQDAPTAPTSITSLEQGAPPPTQATPVAAGAAPTWNLRDPNDQALLSMMAARGMDVGPIITMATATMPKGEAARPGSVERDQFGNIMGQPDSSGLIYGTPNSDGSVPAYDPRTRTWSVVPASGAAQTTAMLTGAKTGAEEAAKAPYTPITIPGAGPGGGSLTQSGTQFAATHGGPGAPALGTPQSTAPIGTVGISPGAEAYSKGQADALNTQLTADVSDTARQTAMAARDTAMRALQVAQTTPFNPATPGAYAGARVLSVLPAPMLKAIGIDPAKIGAEANNIAIYEQATKQLMLPFAKSNLPSRFTQNELALVGSMFGKISDPNSAALLMGAWAVASNDKVLQHNDFARQYQPSGTTPNVQSYQRDWANSPQGRQGLLADPIFQQVKIGGQPVVKPFTFKGRTYLAVLPGLGHPTFYDADGQPAAVRP